MVTTDTGLTLEDLYRFGEDGVRRELVKGRLYVTPEATRRHQRVVLRIGSHLKEYADAHGGEAAAGPNVDFADDEHVEPDVVYVSPERLSSATALALREAPDLVVGISSPGTRAFDLGEKRALYERRGVTEYWFVDLDTDRIEVYALADGRYGSPRVFARGEPLQSAVLAGRDLDVNDLLGDPE